MNSDEMQGKWKQLTGAVREKWGKLTDDDLTAIAGKRDQFIGKLQERYGMSREQAERDLDTWERTQQTTDTPRTRTSGSY
ncbi:MAG: CsbD family protein [Bryobacteraceae bacterium]